MIETSDSIKNLMKALLAFQGDVEGVMRDAANPFHKSKYASLEAVVSTARGPLQEVGIVFTQAPGRMLDGALEVATQLTHAETGEWLRSTLCIPLAKADPQSTGSAITYAQRYSLMAMLGIPPLDDDAEAGMGRADEVRQRPADQKSAYRTRKDGDWDKLKLEMDNQPTPDALRDWGKASRARVNAMPENWQEHFREAYGRKMEDLQARLSA